MACCLAIEIVQVRVADLENSPAMRGDPRLDLNNFEPQISYPRINHQFLKVMPLDAANSGTVCWIGRQIIVDFDAGDVHSRSEEEVMNEALFDPARERYVSLVTFRRSGAEVATPVWIARDGTCYYVFSEGRAGKVKRLANNGDIRLARCNMRGDVSGNWVDGTAHVVSDAATVERAYRALRTKYGWQMKVGDFFSKLSGRYARRAMIEIKISLRG